VLFQRASRQAGKSREFSDLPGISQVALEEIDGFLHIARKRTSEHRVTPEGSLAAIVVVRISICV
jgi:hypothetical protein